MDDEKFKVPVKVTTISKESKMLKMTDEDWIKAISILMFLLPIFAHLQVFETLGVPES